MRRTKTWLIAGLAATVAAGIIGTSPARAHFVQSTQHIANHAWTDVIRPKVYTRTQADARFINAKEKAANSNLLDGLDSKRFMQVPFGLEVFAVARVASDSSVQAKKGPVDDVTSSATGQYVVNLTEPHDEGKKGTFTTTGRAFTMASSNNSNQHCMANAPFPDPNDSIISVICRNVSDGSFADAPFTLLVLQVPPLPFGN